MQSTLEQHGFELHGSTYSQISFNKYVLGCNMTPSWLNPGLLNHRYGGLTV